MINRLLCPLSFWESDCLAHGVLFWIIMIVSLWIFADLLHKRLKNESGTNIKNS
jgi:phosphatidylglycerophosphate synthase